MASLKPEKRKRYFHRHRSGLNVLRLDLEGWLNFEVGTWLQGRIEGSVLHAREKEARVCRAQPRRCG